MRRLLARSARPLAFAAALVVLATGSGRRALAEDELPTGESLLEEMAKAGGGSEAAAKVQTREAKGTFEVVGSPEKGTALSLFGRGSKEYEKVTHGANVQEQGSDGTVAWSRIDGTAKALTGAELHQYLRYADVDLFFGNWKAWYKAAKTLGSEKVGERDCWKVELSFESGDSAETWFLDKETHLLSRVALTIKTPEGDVPVTLDLSDYRDVDGLKISFKNAVTAGAGQYVTTLATVKHGVEVPKGRFDVPDDVKAAMAKEKEGAEPK